MSRDQEIRAKKPIRARITGLFGATADGHKFKPLIIGKARRPRAFQHLSKDLSELPVYYYNNTNAWMTSEIFNDWYLNCFLHEIGDIIDETMPIQFLMDNCSAHNDKLLQIQRPTTSQNPNAHDVRYYPRQRPDVLVDMEHILQRKCKAVAITGVPYTQEELNVTTFRAINENENTNRRTSRKSKFALRSTYSSETDTE